MEITDIRLRKVRTGNKMKAVASITFDGEFVVHDIKVIESQDGRTIIAIPSQKQKRTEEFRDICHPINKEAREKIEKAVLKAYEEAPEAEAETETAEEPEA